MAIDYVALRAEFEVDLRGYGYAPLIASGDDNGLASKINLARTGAVGTVPLLPLADGGQITGIITVPRLNLMTKDFLEAIDTRDIVAANAGIGAYLTVLLQQSSVPLANFDGTKTRIRDNLDRQVQAAQGSQGRLDALATKSGSRFEELSFRGVWGVFNCTSQDVAAAFGRA